MHLHMCMLSTNTQHPVPPHTNVFHLFARPWPIGVRRHPSPRHQMADRTSFHDHETPSKVCHRLIKLSLRLRNFTLQYITRAAFPCRLAKLVCREYPAQIDGFSSIRWVGGICNVFQFFPLLHFEYVGTRPGFRRPLIRFYRPSLVTRAMLPTLHDHTPFDDVPFLFFFSISADSVNMGLEIEKKSGNAPSVMRLQPLAVQVPGRPQCPPMRCAD
ncbi:hypothetical protein BJ166DRAFT_21075 [Pestalotiopsis sp. NC0098]|nr:hypothetical protein BJ166DRAFT_21075 [Pestalotiopsis sp. NC0098]